LLGRGLAVDVEDIKDLLSILPICLEKQQAVIRKKKDGSPMELMEPL